MKTIRFVIFSTFMLILGAALYVAVTALRTGAGDCPNVYVDGNRIGVILKDCEMREYTTFTRLPEGSTIEIKQEQYETAYIWRLAIIEIEKEHGKIRVGRGELVSLWQPTLKEWLVNREEPRHYIGLARGESLKFSGMQIKDGYYLMATGWYETAK